MLRGLFADYNDAGAAGGRNGLSGFRVPVVYSKSRLLPELVRMIEDAWKP